MAERIVMPSFGMYTSEGQLVAWLYPDGATVEAGQPVLEIETQKATESVIAPAAGVLRHIAVRGAQVNEEGLLGYILVNGEALPPEISPATPRGRTAPGAPSISEAPQAGLAQSGTGPSCLMASPIARRLAKEHGLNLGQFQGSGPGGRIVERDILAAVKARGEFRLPNLGQLNRNGDDERGSSLPLPGSRGQVKRDLTVESKILSRTVRFALYLPPDYETSGRSYPVVYLLHGYGDCETAWFDSGGIDQVANESIAGRALPPMILAMPNGGGSFYVNNHDNSVRYEDFFIEEFMPWIESRYRVCSGKASRAVAGVSMGGFGALTYSFRHPELFSACAAFSSSILTDEEFQAESDARWTRVYGNVYGPGSPGGARISSHLKSYSPLHQVQDHSVETIRGLRLHLESGDNDLFYRGNSLLHILLRDRGVCHQYRVRDGSHNWACWRAALPEVMRFLVASFY